MLAVPVGGEAALLAARDATFAYLGIWCFGVAEPVASQRSGIDSSLNTILELKLFQDVVYVTVGGALRNAERLGYLTITHPLGNQVEYFCLPRAQFVQRVRRISEIAVFSDQVPRNAVGKPCLFGRFGRMLSNWRVRA
jgi:hypothetical protein